MTPHDFESLQGKLLAHDLLLRGLYTSWALSTPDPAGAIANGIGGLMDTVRENAPPEDDAEHRIYDHMDAELTKFMLFVRMRLEVLASLTGAAQE